MSEYYNCSIDDSLYQNDWNNVIYSGLYFDTAGAVNRPPKDINIYGNSIFIEVSKFNRIIIQKTYYPEATFSNPITIPNDKKSIIKMNYYRIGRQRSSLIDDIYWEDWKELDKTSAILDKFLTKDDILSDPEIIDVLKGNSIIGVTNYYMASNQSYGITRTTSGWTEKIQTTSPSKKYLWNYEKIFYTLIEPTYSTPVIIGNYASDGNPGETGRGITGIYEYYQLHNRNNSPPTGSWLTIPPVTTSDMRYLWNYEVIEYTSGLPTETEKKVIGVHGQNAYRVEILSKNGNVFKNGVINTVLSARVFRGDEDVTERLDANRFRWTRVSDNEESDNIWNDRYASGIKFITLSTDDIYHRATFECNVDISDII